MTDQTQMMPTDKVREIAAAMRASMHREDGTCRDAEFLDEMSGHIAALEALLPGPTLADMSMEDREECRWMRADVAGVSTRYVIADPRDDDNDAAILVSEEGELEWVFPEHVVPRPDLPRMPWTDTAKPAPALPDGWRLAVHEGHGRVMVTNPTPDAGGYIYFVHSDDEFIAGFDWAACLPDELTYIDQGGDTPDSVPESTLAEGSEWDDADALARACRESERSHIVVVDTRGTVGVWDTGLRCWRVSAPHADFAPYTIIHTGKKADQ